MRLNLGCGTNKLPGWENHDADVDISKRLPWPGGSADFIFIEHCVEHVDYYAAIEFFRECSRVLTPGGVLRVVVPSVEKVAKCEDADYHKLAAKWGCSPDRRGAVDAILNRHGHKTAWTASLMAATLPFCGFGEVRECRVHQSERPELQNVEGHHRVIGEKYNEIESIVFEATADAAERGAAAPAPVPAGERVAVVVGGSESVWQEVEQARELCRIAGVAPEFFVVNDMIAQFAEKCVAVSLHPDKIPGWLSKRRSAGYPEPDQVWSHRTQRGVVTNFLTDHWGGSSGLFAAKIAFQELHHGRVLLCGVPMKVEAQHFIRHQRWNACAAFWRAWLRHREQLIKYVRSFSGNTADLLGRPDVEFLLPKRRRQDAA